MVLRLHGMEEAGVRFSVGPPSQTRLRQNQLYYLNSQVKTSKDKGSQVRLGANSYIKYTEAWQSGLTRRT